MSQCNEGQRGIGIRVKKIPYRGGEENLVTKTGLPSAILAVGNTDTGFAKGIGSTATTRTGLIGVASWGGWLATEMG